jgi:hypothetical protein
MLWLVTLVALGICCMVSTPKALHRYFVAQFTAALFYWLILAVLNLPEYSPAYVVTYCFTVAWIDLTMLGVTWWIVHPLGDWDKRILLGIAMGALVSAVAGWGRHIGFYDAISLLDGFLCVLCAIPVGIAAATGHSRKLSGSLFLLWMAQGLYDLGFSLHWQNAEWLRVNEYLPTFLSVCGSLWLALFTIPRPAQDLKPPDARSAYRT